MVINRIERIIFEGVFDVPHNFVTFVLGPNYYVQSLAGRGGFTIHCEAVSNGNMAERDHITTEQIEKLIQLGWSEAIGETNHTIVLPCESIDDRQNLGEFFYETA